MAPSTLRAEGVVAGYGGRAVVRGVSLELVPGGVTAIVGPNGGGKSTLLRALAGAHRPSQGSILLDGIPLRNLPPRALARRLAFLPQSPPVPTGTTVRELVAYGRYAHQGPFRRASAADREAVAGALAATAVTALADRPVQELSGGERQRALIAMVLAQQAGVLLLDEPTTFLDLRHQVEVLRLLRQLANDHSITIGAVLHDLNQAAACADQVAVLANGELIAAGPPAQVVTAATVRAAFGLDVTVIPNPVSGFPTCLPDLRPSTVTTTEGA